MVEDLFLKWLDALEGRHLRSLRFPEVRRGVQALSSLYVSRRERLDRNFAFNGAGKRAAFAMFFAPLHFLLVREIVRALDARLRGETMILDLGCGTGVAAAAWAMESQPAPQVRGIDQNTWAISECKWTYRELGIDGIAKCADIETVRVPVSTAIIAAFTINELDVKARQRFAREFLSGKAPALIVEPIARSVTPWWGEWARNFKAAGGREDEWRFRIQLPEKLALMDKAAGLDHRELTGRSLWLPRQFV